MVFSSEAWREWTIREWNEALFQYFFATEDGDDAPITRIVVTPEELLRAIGDSSASPGDLRTAFLHAVQSRLKAVNRTLCTDARALERQRWSRSTIPPFFAHLVFTCLVASDVDDEVRDEGNFRKRLNTLLGRDIVGYSYPLADLSNLWEALVSWLDAARERGENYRALELPARGRMVRIGYSINLAFPPRKDQARLIDLLSTKNLDDNPPVSTILRIVLPNVYQFSETFRRVFENFHRLYAEQGVNLYQLFQHPFWSAVRDALRQPLRTQLPKSENEAVRAILRLEDLDTGWFALTLQVDSDCVSDPKRGIVAESTDFPIDEFRFALRVRDNANSQDDTVRLLLAEQLSRLVPQLRAQDLFRAVAEGILLFAPNEVGDYIFSASRPDSDSVYALVRDDLSDSFRSVLSRIGSDHQSFPESRYSGWREVRNLSGGQLASAEFSHSTSLCTVRCLQDVPLHPQIRFRGGMMLDRGWLGLRECLPDILVAQAERVVLQQAVDQGALEPLAAPIDLVRDSQLQSCWRFPSSQTLREGLEGERLLVAYYNGRVLTTRKTSFRKYTIGNDYATPSRPEEWLVETGIQTMATLMPEDQLSGEMVQESEAARLNTTAGLRRSRYASSSSAFELSKDESNRINTLMEIFAGLSLRRQGIAAQEVVEWTEKILGVHMPLTWDVIRAWIENGCLDYLVNRRWRMHRYFAKRPRLVAYHLGMGSRIAATLQGLATRTVRQHLIKVAHEAGVKIETRKSSSLWVPSPLVLEAESALVLNEISYEAGLERVQWLPLIEKNTISVVQMLSTQNEMLLNHVLVGRWNWAEARFNRGHVQQTEDDVCLEWYYREDAPDQFRVYNHEEQMWCTFSRTWALLVAFFLRNEKPFVPDGDVVLQRPRPNGAHLPLTIGRMTAVLGPVPPGPIPLKDGDYSYAYVFLTRSLRDQVLHLLWPTHSPVMPETIVQRARWVGATLRSRMHDHMDVVVPLPRWTQAALSRLEAIPGLEFLAGNVYVPRSLLPHLTALADSISRIRDDNSPQRTP